MWRAPRGTTVPFLLGVVLGAPFTMGLRFDARPPLVWWVYLLFAIAAAGSSALRTRAPERVAPAAALFLGSLGGVVALVARLLESNPTNNMWPVALVLYPLVTAISIALGVAVGATARRVLDRAPRKTAQPS